jgi:hypothetical protein
LQSLDLRAATVLGAALRGMPHLTELHLLGESELLGMSFIHLKSSAQILSFLSENSMVF